VGTDADRILSPTENKMNYIKRLQQDGKDLANEVGRMDAELRTFQRELSGEKFRGVDSDGDRKDWISVRDVNDRIQAILLGGPLSQEPEPDMRQLPEPLTLAESTEFWRNR